MRSKKKIIVLINTVTPYQLNFFDQLIKQVDLKILFYSRKYKNYKFNFQKKKYHIFLDKKKNMLEAIKSQINNFHPDLIIIGGYRMKYSTKVIQILKKKNIKYFYWLENLNKDKLFKYNIVKLLIRNKIKNANGVLSVGKLAKKVYLKYNNNVINLPYSIKVKPIIKKNFFNENKINFLFVGQLIERKGLHFIIKAFSLLTLKEREKIKLHIVGEGNLKKELKKFIKTNTYVQYHGFQYGKRLEKIYERSDVLIFPSVFDGWGVVPMEAMSQSLSLILSKNAGVTEIMEHKKNGYIIDPETNSLLKTIKLLIRNPKIIKTQGRRNNKLILNSLCNSKNSSNYLVKKILKTI